MEACQKMKYELIGQRKGFHILSYYVPKRPKVKKEYFIFQSSSFKTNANLKILFFEYIAKHLGKLNPKITYKLSKMA